MEFWYFAVTTLLVLGVGYALFNGVSSRFEGGDDE
jgi:hypothetical protein